MVDPHFGRCKWYGIYDTENHNLVFIENNHRLNKEKAGHQSVSILTDLGISIVVAGRFGSKVVNAFREKNIQMVIPENEVSVYDIINKIKQ